MRTISYGIPILVLGVLAALPFRRVPSEPLREVEPAEVASPTALVEIDSNVSGVWTPPPTEFAAPSIEPPRLPPLPTDYEHVAVPLATPPVIAERYAAVQPPEPQTAAPTQAVSAFQYQLPPEPRRDAQASSGWATNQPFDDPLDSVVPSTTDRQDSKPAVAALKASFPQPRDVPSQAAAADSAPPRKRYFIREPVGR